MGGPVDKEEKGYESIGCYSDIVTSNFDLSHEIAVSQEWEGRLAWNERDVT